MAYRSSILSFRLAALAFAAWAAFALAVAATLVALLDPSGATAPHRFAPDREVEVLALGTSHATAFHFPSLGMAGHSLHEPRSDLATAELKLRAAQDSLPGLRLVLLAFPPGWLEYDYRGLGGEEETIERWSLNMPFAVGRMGPKEVRARLFGELQFFSRASNLVRQRSGAILGLGAGTPVPEERSCRSRPELARNPDRFGIPGGYLQTPAPAECLAELGARNSAVVAADIDQTRRTIPGIRGANLARIERMAEVARGLGADLVMVVPPYTPHYFEPLARHGDWRRQAADLNALAGRTDGLHFLDFHDFFPPERYREGNRIFYDDNHLTETGAAEFSQALRRRLEAIGLAGRDR